LLFGFYKSVFEFQKIVGLLTWVNLMAFHFWTVFKTAHWNIKIFFNWTQTRKGFECFI
jgi:hypothetical protein